MSTDSALQEVLNSHWLPQIADQISDKLSKERIARERFYDEMTESEKTEFIDGEVIVHSPARLGHIIASRNLCTLVQHWAAKHGGLALPEKALCVLTRNDYEPDLVYFGPEKSKAFTSDTLKFPSPDFVAEVLSESTERFDRGVKFQDFEAHKVGEYWIVDPRDQTVEQYILDSHGKYRLRVKLAAGEVQSEVLRGLTVSLQAIFDPATT